MSLKLEVEAQLRGRLRHFTAFPKYEPRRQMSSCGSRATLNQPIHVNKLNFHIIIVISSMGVGALGKFWEFEEYESVLKSFS